MLTPKYIAIACLQATDNKIDLIKQLKDLPGAWDVINLDGTLRRVDNTKRNADICNEGLIKLAYIKPHKNNQKDNRTYLQVDSMEVYVKYHILKYAATYITCASLCYDLQIGFNIDSFADELGVDKGNIIHEVRL